MGQDGKLSRRGDLRGACHRPGLAGVGFFFFLLTPVAEGGILEAAERTAVEISAEPFLSVAEGVLVHPLDVVHRGKFLHLEIPAMGTVAPTAEQEQIPKCFSMSARRTLKNSLVDESLGERATN